MGQLTVHDGRDPTFIGLLALVAVFFGLIFRIIGRKIPLPYTLLCLLLGLVLGEIAFRTGLGALGDSISVWLQLDPHTILFLFLPPLIYESAASMHHHTFTYSITQSLLLAVPGVFISALLTAVIAIYILPHEWDFRTGMALGSILAATDPVAVVALLRELGAPLTLATIIEGESLLNDGVAFVLFQYYLEELQGNDESTGKFFSSFFYMSFVGWTVGYILGQCIVVIMGLIFDDSIAIVMLSAAGAFGSFYIVDGLLQASGVLGVVAFGVAFASRRSGNISHAASEALETVWESLGYLANTLVFVYSGVIIVNFAFHSDFITGSDYLYLLLLFLLIQFVRGFVILALSPILARTGYGFNWRQGVLFTWSGLRGAVGLTLGLFVVNDKLVDDATGARIMFYVAGIAGCTLLINGTTAGFLVGELNLDRSSAAAKVFHTNVVRRFKERVNTTLAVARRDDYFKGADWTAVWSQMPIFSTDMRHHVERQMGAPLGKHESTKVRKYLIAVENSYAIATPEEVQRTLVQDARHRFLNLVKSMYNIEFEHGALESRPAFQILVDATSSAQDRCDDKGLEWLEVSSYCQVPKWVGMIPFQNLKHWLIDMTLGLGYELAAIFIKVHIAVEAEFVQLIANDKIAQAVLQESSEQICAAQTYLDDMNTNFADITGAFKTRWAAQWILRDSFVFAQDLRSSGDIEEKEYRSLIRGINRSRGMLFKARFRATKPQERIQVLRNSDLLEGLTPECTAHILSLFQEQEYLPDETISIAGEPSRGLFIITNGKVRMTSKVGSQEITLRVLTCGNLIGDFEVVTHSNSQWTNSCETNVRGYLLKNCYVLKLLEKHEGKRFERNLYLNAGANILQSYRILECGVAFAPEQMSTILHESRLARPENDTIMEPNHGFGVFFSGKCAIVPENDTEELEWITTACKLDFSLTYKFLDDSCIMWVPPYVKWSVDECSLEETRESLVERSRTQIDAEGGVRRSRPRARTSSIPNVGLWMATPRRLSRFSSRSKQVSSSFSSPRTPRTPRSPAAFADNPLAGISDINYRFPHNPVDDPEDSSDDIVNPVQTPRGGRELGTESQWYGMVQSPEAACSDTTEI